MPLSDKQFVQSHYRMALCFDCWGEDGVVEFEVIDGQTGKRLSESYPNESQAWAEVYLRIVESLEIE